MPTCPVFTRVKIKPRFGIKANSSCHIIDKNGSFPDPARSLAIKEMLVPKNVKTLQAFLGFTNYYNVFIKNMYNLLLENY